MKLLVYLHVAIKQRALQSDLQAALSGHDVSAVGRIGDFERLLAEGTDAVLALPVVLGAYKLSPTLQGQRAGSGEERYSLVGVGSSPEPGKVQSVGALNLLGRDGTSNFVRSLVGGSPKVERVSKVEDLLPLLQMQLTEAILLPSWIFPELRAASKLALAARELAKTVGLPAVASVSPGAAQLLSAVSRLPLKLAKLDRSRFMALTRRDLLFTLPLCASVLAGCSKASVKSPAELEPRELMTSRSAGPAAPTILVLMPETAQTKEVWGGLRDELDEDYQLVAVRVEVASDSAVIEAALRRYAPAGLVLMNNPTVSAFRRMQRMSPARKFPPAVIVMTSFLETQTSDLHGATGISYEVPLITAMTNLRRLLVLQNERVGVVSRAPLRGFIKRQIDLSAREKVAVIQEEVSQSPNPSELKRAIRRLKGAVDVIWILNDDKLLTPKLISEGWLPGLDERPWVPTIVGAASLLSAGSNFGTFAVLPDHAALGAQAASMLLDISENNWQLDGDERIQLPLSTTTTIDLVQTRERFQIQPDALKQVDRISE